MLPNAFPEVYTAREIALAAGVSDSQVRTLLERGDIRSVAAFLPGAADPKWDVFVPHAEAIRAVRALKAGDILDSRDSAGVGRLLSPAPPRLHATTVPFLVSTSLHGLVVAILLVIGSLGLTSAEEKTDLIEEEVKPVRMVYLALPGPGGGGGGGGMRMKAPPPKAERKGPQRISSPIPARRLPPPIRPEPKPVEPPPAPLEAKTIPPVMAPVAPVAADPRNQEGLMKEVPPQPASQGAGTGGGTGSGQGTGLGEGNGAGIGPGEGGGTGGGPYRPGSGVTPPQLLKEVRANYTEEARRANVAGEVVLEIIVRRDGTVGDVKILERLGSGLDQRAVEAVRQWRFAPARLKGVPVDVVVEVAVEFKLR